MASNDFISILAEAGKEPGGAKRIQRAETREEESTARTRREVRDQSQSELIRFIETNKPSSAGSGGLFSTKKRGTGQKKPSSAASIFGSRRSSSSTVVSKQGFSTTAAGLEIIEVLQQYQDPLSPFKAQDFQKLAGFNVRPIPGNYHELSRDKQQEILTDRYRELTSEKGRISRLGTDIKEGFLLEEKKFQEKGLTLKALKKRIKVQRKEPLTFGRAVEQLFARPGRAVVASVDELLTGPMSRWKAIQDQEATGKKVSGFTKFRATLPKPIRTFFGTLVAPIAETRQFKLANTFRKLGFRTKTLAEIFPDAYSETGKGLQLQRGGIWDFSAEGITGFAGDVLLDPIMWITGGVGRSLRLIQFAEKGIFTGKVGNIGNKAVYLNQKGMNAFERIAKPLQDRAKKAGNPLTERQITQKVSPRMYSQYGDDFERGQHLIDHGGLKLAVPLRPDISTGSLIKGKTFSKSWNNFMSFVPKSVKSRAGQFKGAFGRVWFKYFGGEGASIKNQAIRDRFVGTSAMSRVTNQRIRETNELVVAKAIKNGVSDREITLGLSEVFLNQGKQIADRSKLLHKALQGSAKRSSFKAAFTPHKQLSKINPANLEDTLKLAHQFEKQGIITNAKSLIKQVEKQVHNSTQPLQASKINGIKHTEATQVLLDSFENINNSIFKEWTNLNPELAFNGRLKNYFTAIELNKVHQLTTMPTGAATRKVGSALNSLKRSVGINAKNIVANSKRILKENNPEAIHKFNHDILVGNMSNQSSVNVATQRLTFQNYVGDLYKHLPKNQLVPLSVVKGVKPAMVPPEIAQQIMSEFVRKSASGPDEFLKWYKWLGAEGATNIWKMSVTVMYPAFHIRNNVTDFINAFTDRGLSAFLGWGETAKMYSAKNRKNMVLKTANGSKTMKADDMFNELRQKEIVRSSAHTEFSLDDVQDVLGHESFFLSKTARRAAEWGPIKLGMTVTGFSEDFWRLNTAIHTWKKTGSMELAAQMANKFHANYRQVLSPFERKVVKRILPFYTFTKHNIPLQLQNWMTKPGLTKFPIDMINAASEEMSEEEMQTIPQWMMGRFFFKTGVDKNGKSEYTIVGGIPSEEAFGRFFTKDQDGNFKMSDMMLKSVGGLLNPGLKFIVEEFFDRSLFFGGKIRGNGIEIVYDKPPQAITSIFKRLDLIQPDASRALKSLISFEGPRFDKKSGKDIYSMNPVAMHILQSLPISRFISEASRLSDEDRTKLEGLTAFMSNISFKSIDTATKIETKEKRQRGDLISILEQESRKTRAQAFAEGKRPPARPTRKKKKKNPFEGIF